MWMMRRLAVLLLFYQFAGTLSVYYQQQTYDLIKNIINWHNFNSNFWLLVSDGADIDAAFFADATPKALTTSSAVNYPTTRNFAAIFFADQSTNMESQLDASRKLPPDVIKIYLDRTGCRLNEAKLAGIVNAMWRSDEIAFIYYIARCCLSTTSNYDAIDNVRRSPQEDNYNCAINLYHHQPFALKNEGQWGLLAKVALINDLGGGRRQWINMSSRGFQEFPFQSQHRLNLNRVPLTVILFPSASAYHRSELAIFRHRLAQELLDDPLHHIEAYFGEDAEVLRELQLQMNFTLILSPTSDHQLYGFRQPNGSFNGALGDIINRRADFISNGCFVKDYLTDLLELTASINDDKLCIVTKTAALVPDSLLIFRLFTRFMWLSIAITVLAVAVAYTILMTMIDCTTHNYDEASSLGKFQDKSFCQTFYRRIKGDTSILYRIIGLMLGSPTVGIRATSHERLFVSTCLLWSLVLCGAFQGSLYNVLTTPKSYPNIDTLDDLYESRLDIHVRHPGLLTDIFGDEKTNTTVGNLRAKRLKTTDDDALNERIVSRGDVAGLARYANYDYDNHNLTPRKDGKSNLHIVGECPRSYTLAYLFRKRSIYIDTVNWNINMFMQSGLVAKWRRQSKYYFKLEAALKHRRAVNEGEVKINLKHLQMAFVGMAVGSALSCLVFVVERVLAQREANM